MGSSTYETIMNQRKEAEKSGDLPKIKEFTLYGVSSKNYSFRNFQRLCEETGKIIRNITQKVKEGDDFLSPENINFAKYLLIKLTKNRKGQALAFNRLAAEKVADKFKGNTVLTEILTNHDLEIFLNYLKKEWIESSEEVVKEFKFKKTLTDYIFGR